MQNKQQKTLYVKNPCLVRVRMEVLLQVLAASTTPLACLVAGGTLPVNREVESGVHTLISPKSCPFSPFAPSSSRVRIISLILIKHYISSKLSSPMTALIFCSALTHCIPTICAALDYALEDAAQCIKINEPQRHMDMCIDIKKTELILRPALLLYSLKI